MGSDLKEIFRKEREGGQIHQMDKGHMDRFLSKLDQEMPKQQQPAIQKYMWLKIAAGLVLLIGLSVFFLLRQNPVPVNNTPIVDNDVKQRNNAEISLGDLSDDLKKVENYYVTSINLQLANLKVSDDNRELVDGYMEQLSLLSAEYKLLIKELNEIGPNDRTISALITNFQLQLGLVQKLQSKIKEYNTSRNEQEHITL